MPKDCSRFTPEERRLIQLVTAGHSLQEVADAIGASREVARLKLRVTLDKVADQARDQEARNAPLPRKQRPY